MDESQQLLARLHSFCFPGGEEAARHVRALRTTQRGEMQMSPNARLIPFLSDELTYATRSSFSWEARLDPGTIRSLKVTDAYDEGHGRLVVKAGGVITVAKISGPDTDKGELQRYFSSIGFCPPILVNNAALEYTAVGPSTLRISDRNDTTGATVDLEISADGEPVSCRAERPRLVGKKTISTSWSGTCGEFQEWEGLRLATRVQACWHLSDGPFTYYRGKITSFTAVR